jgi:acetyl esterase/lipase
VWSSVANREYARRYYPAKASKQASAGKQRRQLLYLTEITTKMRTKIFLFPCGGVATLTSSCMSRTRLDMICLFVSTRRPGKHTHSSSTLRTKQQRKAKSTGSLSLWVYEPHGQEEKRPRKGESFPLVNGGGWRRGWSGTWATRASQSSPCGSCALFV